MGPTLHKTFSNLKVLEMGPLIFRKGEFRIDNSGHSVIYTFEHCSEAVLVINNM